MKAQLIIRKTNRGYIVEIDNGYNQTVSLTDFLDTFEEAQSAALKFVNQDFKVIE